MIAPSHYTGRVTETGVMLDGGYLYEAEQICTLYIESITGTRIAGKLHRTERTKTINGVSVDEQQTFPDYLRRYLEARDEIDEHFEGDMQQNRIRATGTPINKNKNPAVYWSQRNYDLVVTDSHIAGAVIDNEPLLTDRILCGGALSVSIDAYVESAN